MSGERERERALKNGVALFLIVLGLVLFGWQAIVAYTFNGLTLVGLILIVIGIWRYTE